MTLPSRALLLLLMGSAAHAPPACAQRWAADVYAGGTRYDALAPHTGSANLVGNLRYQTSRLSAYLSAAAPMDGDAPVWGAFGAAARPSLGIASGLRASFEAAGDGYAFRHSGGVSGFGFSTHLLPTLSIDAHDVLLELRGGRHDHIFRTDDDDRHIRLHEAGFRGTVGTAQRYAILDLRSLLGDGRSYPMVQLQLGAALGPARAWVAAGRWFGADLAESTWSAGVSVDAGSRGELWAGARHDAADPLYVSPARTTWNIGYSIRLGDAPTPSYAPIVRSGSVVLRLPRDGDAPPAVAGEFNQWTPMRMRASGDEWRIEIPVRTGVYRFAFVTASGEWFVPEDYPGRMSDDMGGYIALVIVP